MYLVKSKGYKIVSICNNVNSSLGYNSDMIFPIFANQEVSVAATKSFTAMLYVGMILLDKQIIKLYLGLVNNKRWRQYEIAKKFGFSKYYVSNSITNTLKQMKICLQEQGIIEMTEDKNSSVVKNDNI